MLYRKHVNVMNVFQNMQEVIYSHRDTLLDASGIYENVKWGLCQKQ